MKATRSPGRKLGIIVAAVLAMAAVMVLPSLASAKDRNHDRIPDKWEKHFKLSLKVNQAKRDQDRDGLRNRAEFRARMNPRDADTNNDGTTDGDENAGTITSFTDGKLTIALFGGDSISGLVDDTTRIRCRVVGGDDPVGDDDPGDDSSSARHDGSTEPNDGDGGGEDPGDGDGNPGDGDGHHGDGDGHPGPGGGDGNQADCTVADLVEGAVVHEAEIEVEHGQAVFEKVDIVKDATPAPTS
jgi:hypothetical protein